MRSIFLVAAMMMQIASVQAGALKDLAFLEGNWRGGSDSFVFEEYWWPAEGGVMTGMARGVREGELAVLEYIIIEETEDGAVMRFKHFNADYSNWEGEEIGPITLSLARAEPNDVVFEALENDAHVSAIRYYVDDDGRLHADVTLIEDGNKGGFSLVFEKVTN